MLVNSAESSDALLQRKGAEAQRISLSRRSERRRKPRMNTGGHGFLLPQENARNANR